jgi:hypothetical protein
MGRTLVRNVAIPGWGFLVLMEAQGFHYLVPIYIYIYIYCFYILHLGAFNIENAPRPNLRARSEPTVPPRSSSSVFVPPARLRRSRPLPTELFHFPAHAPLSLRTTQPLHISCNHTRLAVAITPDQSLQLHQTAVAIIVCLTDFWT